MKRLIEKLKEEVVRRDFPMADLVDGWFFRCCEVSAGVYIVEGTDLWARKVGAKGADEDQLLRDCVESARSIRTRSGDTISDTEQPST
jgi:hypothetical protein